jgi:hypothetical protein
LEGVAALRADDTFPLSLCEQLDAMLLGWLERCARRQPPAVPGRSATAVLTIADDAMADVARFCAGWGMTVTRPSRGTVALVEGPARAVEGFAEIAVLRARTE